MIGKKFSHIVTTVAVTVIAATSSNLAGSSDVDKNAELYDAYKLYQRAKMEDLKLTTDPNELSERMTFHMLKGLASENRYEDIFNIGDEAFEKESDARFGKGVGPIAIDGSIPSRLLTDVGGMDSSSCRSCHFKGGPDGSGTMSSIAMLRSDGVHAKTATPRDSPHVMGVGYIQLVAQEMTDQMQDMALRAREYAMSSGQSVTRDLTVKNISFGKITAMPNGLFDTSEVRHVRKDLVVRPFGHKGRARNLFEFVDEALQMHHGMQTDARVEKLEGKAELVGGGPAWDPDLDGYQFEAAAGRSMLIAAYLSMLPVPSIIPPKSNTLAMAWGNGQRLFESVGCASCHVPELRFNRDVITHEVPDYPELKLTIALLKYAQTPSPIVVDHVFDTDNISIPGMPFYPFTDLRLHDLGPELADEFDEPNIVGDFKIGKSIWLTRSLWGLADTGPYLHDGRATTVEEAINWHGGEAEEVKNRFNALDQLERRSILVYLASLTRDPTALIE